jgi:hypothetical protein
MTVETDILDDRLFENDKWLYMVYFKGGYKRLFGLMDSRFSHYRTDLVKIYEPGHTGQRYKSNFFNHTSKITERTNESISSEGSAYRRGLVRWNYIDLEDQNTEYVDWTRKERLVYDVRQLSIREVIWSLGYLRNDSSIQGRIMPFWPFSPVRRDDLNLYLERRPQLKAIMNTQGKEVVLRERELSVSSTSSHEYERVYRKDVEKEVNVEIIEKNKKPPKIKKSASLSSEEMIVKEEDQFSDSSATLNSSVSSTKSKKGASKGVILAMIVWGSLVVGSMLGSKIMVMNLLPPPSVSTPPKTNPTPVTNIVPQNRIPPTKEVPKDPPQIVLKKTPEPKSSSTQTPIQPIKHKTTHHSGNPHMSKTKTKPVSQPTTTVPPKQIKSIPVKPKHPPQKVFVDSQHSNHMFVVEHHYIQPQFVISPSQANAHPPIININNETASESQPAPVAPVQPVPVSTPIPTQTQTPTTVVHQVQVPTPAPTPAPVVVTPQPNGPISLQPKIEFNPVIKPTINVPVHVKTTAKAPKAATPKTINKTYNNHHFVNNVTPGTNNHVEKLVESTNQVEEIRAPNKNQNNMIVSDETELPDINALVNDIKMNVSSDQEMHDLQNLIIHRDMRNDRKVADTPASQPMKIIIQNKSSSHHRGHHHHHHHNSGSGFLGILTTTIKRHPKRSHRGHHHHHSFGMSSSHHSHHSHNNGFISQIRVNSKAPEAPPVRIKKSTSGKIKESGEALNFENLNMKDQSAAVRSPVVVHSTPVANCSKNTVVPVKMNPNCFKQKKKTRRKKRKRKLRSKKKKSKKRVKSNDTLDNYYDPLFNNDGLVMDNALPSQKSSDWDKRFNLFNYFDQAKGLPDVNDQDFPDDPSSLMSFDYPGAMQMGLDNGLNDKAKTPKRKSHKTKNLSI